MNRISRTIAAVGAATLMALLPVATASADVCSTCYGAIITNMSMSNGKVIVQNNGRNMDLWPGQISYVQSANFRDVDYFWVPGGCDAKNYDTGYVYVGNRWYGPLPDSARLRFDVYC